MPFWDGPKAAVRVPLKDVVVAAEYVNGERPRHVTMAVQHFVIWMVQMGNYPKRALPRDAVISAALDFYICTLEEDGHACFISNSGWDQELRDDIREGLARLGFDELGAVFAELEAFARDDPERFEASDWSDPVIQSLDARFLALPRDSYFERHAQWIRSWPNLRLVPETEQQAVWDALAKRNRERRRWWSH